MKKQEIIAKVEELLQPIEEALGYEVVDVEYEKEGKEWYLRVYADKKDGFTIDDCVALSHALDDALEETNFIDTAYHLQVSSPGLDRPLKKDKDFLRHLEELVEVKLYGPKEEFGPDREFIAMLKAYDGEAKQVTLETEDGKTAQLHVKDIALIRPAVIF